MTSYWICLVKF